MLRTRTNSHYQPSLQFENNEVVGRFGGRVECCIKNFSSNILPPIQAVKNLGKYLYISNFKFTMKGCRHKFAIFYFFLEQDLNCLHAKFQVYGTSPLVFCPKMPSFFHIFSFKKSFWNENKLKSEQIGHFWAKN